MPEGRAIRDTNKQAQALAGIRSLDVGAVRAELHDDLVMHLPYEDAVTSVFAMYKRCDVTPADVYDRVDPNPWIATGSSNRGSGPSIGESGARAVRDIASDEGALFSGRDRPRGNRRAAFALQQCGFHDTTPL